MKVVARDLLQHLRTSCEHRNLWTNDAGQRLRSFGVDEEGVELIPACNCPLNDEIALGHKEPGHVAVRTFPDLPHDVITKSLELKDSRIVWISDLDPVWVGDRWLWFVHPTASRAIGLFVRHSRVVS